MPPDGQVAPGRRPVRCIRMRVYSLIDLFAGCGGMTLGFEQTGRFRSTFAVDADPYAAATYRANFNGILSTSQIEDVTHFPKADVIIGGPPCQGFSPLNRERVGFSRRSLWREYLRAVTEARAMVFVMENVPELLRSPEFIQFSDAAAEIGFTVTSGVLNAADFGVAQHRRRAVVIGSRIGEITWPTVTHHRPHPHRRTGSEWVTFRAAVAGLPLTPDGENWHVGRRPWPVSIERYRTIPAEGEGRFELAERRPDITPPCWLKKTSGSTDVFGRLWWDRPSVTIRTEFHKPEKGRYLHPSEHRAITPREAARCMSFPDDFVFPLDQSMSRIAKQIGNAVPPLLARAIAEGIAETLDTHSGYADRDADRRSAVI